MTFRSAVVVVSWTMLSVSSVVAQECSSIGDVDFRNAIVQLKPTQDWPISRLPFHNGVFDQRDKPNGVPAGDWRYKIDRDTVVRPESQTTIRFLQILREHVSGTKSFTCLVGFSCSQGTVKNVFQECGEFMKIISLTPQSLHLELATRKESDAYGSPSIKVERSFIWSRSLDRYVERPDQ